MLSGLNISPKCQFADSVLSTETVKPLINSPLWWWETFLFVCSISLVVSSLQSAQGGMCHMRRRRCNPPVKIPTMSLICSGVDFNICVVRFMVGQLLSPCLVFLFLNSFSSVPPPSSPFSQPGSGLRHRFLFFLLQTVKQTWALAVVFMVWMCCVCLAWRV